MGVVTELVTDRLLLRQWREDDKPAFAAMNADPVVMEHFPALLTSDQSDEFVDRMRGHIDAHGWGLWAVDVRETGAFIGFVGLWPAGFDPFRSEDLVEVGWRLEESAWGHGYASEAALASLRHAFDVLELAQVVSFTSLTNVRSQAVMQRIGMTRDRSAEFEHPRLPEGHRLRTHVVYRIESDRV